jgi:hypothetical protein
MLKNKEFLYLLKSTAIVFIVSAIGALGISLFGYNFIASFLILTCIQYILFSTISSVINSFFIEKTKQKELEKIENLSTILNCAYCNQQNLMTFLPDDGENMEFVCDHCKKKNSVKINFIVARITEPVTVPKVEGISLEDI